MKCTKCGSVLYGPGVPYGYDILCRDCLLAAADAGNICPCCGAQATPHDSVGLLLALPDATPQEKAAASTALAIICPHCHVLFFDGFQFNLLRSLRDAATSERQKLP